MTENFKHTLKWIGYGLVALLAAFFWLKHNIRETFPPPQIALPADDKELITYDGNRHRIAVTTAEGTKYTYSRNPEVEIRKDGTVKVNAKAWGGELRPFLGVGYSDTGRAYTGCQLFYFHQFDAGVSFGWTADGRKPMFQPMLSLSWNFYSNSSVHLGFNPVPFVLQTRPELAIFLSVRL